MEIQQILASEFELDVHSSSNLIKLLDEGQTIPFIARYRKDQTGGSDEVVVQNFLKRLNALRNLQSAKKRAERRFKELGLWNDEMLQILDSCGAVSDVNDLLAPYTREKKTRAAIARDLGLQKAADIIMGKKNGKLKNALKSVPNAKIESVLDIVAEESVRHPKVKKLAVAEFLFSRIKVNLTGEVSKYQNYVQIDSKLDHLKSHQIHALLRGEKDGLIKISINYNFDTLKREISALGLHHPPSKYRSYFDQALEDGIRRLLIPRVTRAVKKLLKEGADSRALVVFEENLMNLLLTPPIKPEPILALDPGFKSGCKVAVVNENGDLLATDVVYPTTSNQKKNEAEKKLKHLLKKYTVDFIVIGNGTASRETMEFIQQRFSNIRSAIVSEAGASVYSASKIAREEFPDLATELRGAISIARRVLDPLTEYVKIDPKSLGVGQYQHDIDPKRLEETLNFTVSRAVNRYGISVTTASEVALTYVSGITKSLARRIIDYRRSNEIRSRKQLLKISGMGKVKFQQCSGFLRVPNSEIAFDNTMIHPEDYKLAERILGDNGLKIDDLKRMKLVDRKRKLRKVNCNTYSDGEIGVQRVQDIVEELIYLGIDRRGVREFHRIIGQVKSIEEVKEDMVLIGKVTNVTDFGAFVNIGLKENGLIHKSNFADRFIPNVYAVIKIGDFVKTKVIQVETDKKRISLKLLEVNGKKP